MRSRQPRHVLPARPAAQAGGLTTSTDSDYRAGQPT